MNRHDRTIPERLTLRKAIYMYRFTLLTILILLGLETPAHARSNPKPPPIEVCYGGLCVTDLRWPERLFGDGLAAVQGVLINNSPTTLTTLTIQFTAMFASSDGERVITRVESGLVQGLMLGEDPPQRLRQPLQFDPLFSPWHAADRKQWEKLHGSR